jgi:hypothetical protein
MFRKTFDGVTHLVTRTSHGMDEIGDNLAKRTANQCALQLVEFWNLVDCGLSEGDAESVDVLRRLLRKVRPTLLPRVS